MTLQEKIDKLPLSIPYCDELDYELLIEATMEEVCDQSKFYNISTRLEDVIDRALTIIENEDW